MTAQVLVVETVNGTIALHPCERRGGSWGYFEQYADTSRFVALAHWKTKRDAEAHRQNRA